MAIQIHEKKYHRQLLGIERWKKAKSEFASSHSDGWGTWWWQTGVGKTFAACTLITKMLEKNNARIAKIMVPGPELKKQWTEAIKSYIHSDYQNNISIYTVGEINKIIEDGSKIVCDLFIADELHEYYSENRRKIFTDDNVITKWMLGLTADYEDKDKRHEYFIPILPVVDRISQEEALKEGYISKYIEYNVGINLNPNEAERYKVLSDIISKNLSKFGGGSLELASKILSGDKNGSGLSYAIRYATSKGWRKDLNPMNERESSILQMWSPNIVIGYAKLAMDSIRERKNLLYRASGKLVGAKDVVFKFENLKTICFSQSTIFADALGKMINKHYEDLNNPRRCTVYHSQLETKIITDENGKQKKKGQTVLKREAIEFIKQSSNGILSTASSLDKGLDIPDIRLALTTSGTQNPTQYNQRRGRAVRREEDENIIVLIINLYIKNTMDEVWLKKRQSKSKSLVYWVDSIDDIIYSPKMNVENEITI